MDDNEVLVNFDASLPAADFQIESSDEVIQYSISIIIIIKIIIIIVIIIIIIRAYYQI